MAKLALNAEGKNKLYQLCGTNSAARQAVTAVINAMEFEFDDLQPSPEDLHAALQVFLLKNNIISADNASVSGSDLTLSSAVLFLSLLILMLSQL